MKGKVKRISSVGAFIKGVELTDSGSIELLGSRRVIVEDALGIIEYEDNIVRIHTRGKTVVINGSGLSLDSYSGGIIIVDGKIRGVSLE